MRQKGRKSAASLATVPPVSGIPSRAPAPAHLPDRARAVWASVVSSRTPDFFDRGALPILSAFCFASAEHARLVEALAEMEPTDPGFGVLTRLADLHAQRIGTLATKLRLSKQSTTDSRSAGRASRAEYPNLDWSKMRK